ncbi:MAG: YCII-related protein [Nocardioides sp.]|nr:YCII-related protein [Nocardioides sp.]
MKFLVLMAEVDHFDRWAASSDAEQQAVFDRFTAFSEAVRERGSLLQGEALADPATSRTLTAGEVRAVRDGPYAETVEQVGGFYLVELPDLETAVDVARLLPPAYTIEVRPVIAT